MVIHKALGGACGLKRIYMLTLYISVVTVIMEEVTVVVVVVVVVVAVVVVATIEEVIVAGAHLLLTTEKVDIQGQGQDHIPHVSISNRT